MIAKEIHMTWEAFEKVTSQRDNALALLEVMASAMPRIIALAKTYDGRSYTGAKESNQAAIEYAQQALTAYEQFKQKVD
jgi:hypothetical protein